MPSRSHLRPGRPSTGRRALSEVAADHIRLMIFTGALRPGDRIAVDEIAAAVGVSRLPVREAVNNLGTDGLLVVLPHRGAFVGDLDERFLREHFEIAGMIQGLAAASLVEHHDVAAVDRLAALSTRADSGGPTDEVYADVVEFFAHLYDAGGSAAQRAVLHALGRLLPAGWFKDLPGAIEASLSGMADIVSALRRGDADAVRQACSSGQRERCEVVVRQLRATGVLAATSPRRH